MTTKRISAHATVSLFGLSGMRVSREVAIEP